jgi:hypothetical protein
VRRAIDFVCEHELREHGAFVELEPAAVAVKHGYPEHVGGQEVARELNAVVAEPQGFRERVRERGLADAGQVLDEQVAAREQARQRQLELTALADHDALERLDDGSNQSLAVGAAARDQRRCRHAGNRRLNRGLATPQTSPFVTDSRVALRRSASTRVRCRPR